MAQSESESLPKLYTKAEVAKYLRLSERHINNLMNSRSIECVKLGRPVRFTKEAIFEMQKKLTIKAKIYPQLKRRPSELEGRLSCLERLN